MEPSYGEVPGTIAYSIREADAEPDEILKAPPLDGTSSSDIAGHLSNNIPVPKTVVTKIDHTPSHGEVKGTDAYQMRRQDAQPDVVEEEDDVF